MSTASPEDIIVLHIDDDTSQLDFTKLFITKNDPKISVDTVSSQNEVLDRDLNKYDCIISDYAMPKMNGIELAEKIRETSDIPIILYTGQGSEEVAEQAFSVGIDDYLRKEFDPSHYKVLAKRIRNAVEKDRALNSLKQNEELLNKYLDSAPYSVHIFNSDLRLIRINKRARSNLGTSDVQIGQHITEISPGLEKLPRFKEYQKVIETGIPYSEEIVIPHSERDEVNLYIIAYKVGDGMGLILQDITERKRIERQLISSEKRYHDYIDNAPDGILVVNYDGEYIEINNAVTKITGFSKDEIIGNRVGEVFAPLDDPGPLSLFNQVKNIGEGTGDLPFRHKNGEIRWLNVESVRLSENRIMAFIKDITDRKHIENELSNSQELLNTFMDSAPVSFHIFDSNLNLIKYNEAAEKAGITPDMIGKHILELAPGMRDTGRYEEYLKVIQTGKQYYTDHVTGARDDEIRHLTIRAFKAGEGLGLIISDITDYIKSEQNLHEKETQYQTLFRESNDAIIIQDFDGKIIEVNNRAIEMLGYSHKELLSMNIHGIHPKDDLNHNIGRSRVITEGSARFNRKFQKKNGEIIEVEISSSVVDREKRLIQGLVRDVTDISRISDRLKALHIHSTDIASAKSVTEIAELTFKTIEKVLGFHQGGFATINNGKLLFKKLKNVNLLYTLEIPLSTPSIMARAAKTSKSQLVSKTENDPDFLPGDDETDYDPKSALAVPVNLDNNVVAIINVESLEPDAFTIEDQELVETLAMHVSSAMSKLKLVEGLEKRVREKTNELLSAEQMIAAGRVASMVGHDLRGPLQTIKNAEYLMDQSPDETAEMIELINKSVDRAQNMISELRNRIRNTPLKIEQVDIEGLIMSTIRESKIPSEISVITEFNLSRSHSVDKQKLRRVLDNLIHNSVDAISGKGNIVIKSSTDSNGLFIKISDTGKGIHQENLDNLFKPFYTTKTDGIGLGLAYCKRTIESHGGTISVESEVGKGTKFTIFIPNEEPVESSMQTESIQEAFLK